MAAEDVKYRPEVATLCLDWSMKMGELEHKVGLGDLAFTELAEQYKGYMRRTGRKIISDNNMESNPELVEEHGAIVGLMESFDEYANKLTGANKALDEASEGWREQHSKNVQDIVYKCLTSGK